MFIVNISVKHHQSSHSHSSEMAFTGAQRATLREYFDNGMQLVHVHKAVWRGTIVAAKIMNVPSSGSDYDAVMKKLKCAGI